MSRGLITLGALALALAAGAACGPVQAKTPTDDGPLTTPAAPARVIVPVTIEAPVPVEPAKPASRETTTQAPARPAVPPPSTPPASTTPPQPDPLTPILQTAGNVTETEKRVRTALGRALADLARVDYKGLSQDAKAQYDQAKRFIEQADAALKVKNVVFAEQLADKAASLASSLVRRQ